MLIDFPRKVLDIFKEDSQPYVNYFMKKRREGFFSAHKTCMTMRSKLERKKKHKRTIDASPPCEHKHKNPLRILNAEAEQKDRKHNQVGWSKNLSFGHPESPAIDIIT